MKNKISHFDGIVLCTFPEDVKYSCRYLEAKIAEMRTLKAPSGVTKDAGAKP